MPSPSKSPLSPAELAQLEAAFATDPNSDAYRALAEAYLGMGRFMEAMVVCKKGVKAHPDRADPRVLLARVYAEQGKDRKAIEELEGALNTDGKDLPALRMAGALLLKTGDNDKGKDYLLRAFKANSKDAETKELLEKWKIEVPVEAPTIPVQLPPDAAAMVAAAPQAPLANGTPQPMLAVNPALAGQPVTAPNALPPGYPAQMTQPNMPMNGQNGVNGQNGQYAQPAGLPPGYPVQPTQPGVPMGMPPGYPQQVQQPAPQQPRPQRPRPPAQPQRPQIDLSKFEEPEVPVRKPGNSGAITLGFLALAVITLGGFYAWSAHKKQVAAQIGAALHETGESLRNDSYGSYKKATESAEAVLKIDPDSIAGHAYLAYIYAIRWGEHGDGETAKNQAIEHLEKAKKLKQDHSHLFAAEAMVAFFGGQANEAQANLEKKSKELEDKGKSSALIAETLGIIQMKNGDLEKASASLKKALDLAPAEPRIHAALGDLYRRQGAEINAWNYYDNALRYERDHAGAVLGKTLLVLEAERPNYQIAEDLLKRVLNADPPPSPRELAMAYLLDGIRLNQLGKKDEGLRQEQKALDTDRNNPEIYVLRGRRMIKDGQLNEGLAEIKKAISLDPKRASFYVELARAQMAIPNGAKDAIQSLNTALKTLPSSAKLQSLLGDAYQKSGDAKSAKDAYEKALGFDTNAKLPDTRMALGRLYQADKNYPKAKEFYDRAATEYAGTNNKVAEATLALAQMSEEKGESPEVLMAAYQKVLEADQNYAPGYYFIGKFLASQKKKEVKEKGKEALAQYLKLDPKGPYAAQAAALAAAK